MSRVKRGVTARARHKKTLAKAKGYYGARSRVYRVAKQAVTKAAQYAYRNRRQKKRDFRSTRSRFPFNRLSKTLGTGGKSYFKSAML